jgi:hypothetical protein
MISSASSQVWPPGASGALRGRSLAWGDRPEQPSRLHLGLSVRSWCRRLFKARRREATRALRSLGHAVARAVVYEDYSPAHAEAKHVL